ncbi:MAG: tRNA uridine-5-carboxymethylaminomethyl(34) synthesis GTPase MnmE [Firmicutes bacterium]|nr:tRNA uridine-5-carboxymethylaminomethyl(34) synthesis GTPase MnmE [Bacillota bacterium]MDY6173578.1 tRNA uridine-5-carboxymethylaminomethyl(34) synthesis GTPase MnmE [Lentihominibacter sp.]
MEDTIAAIATAYGEGGIGIIRISGEDSRDILRKIFTGKIESRRLSYGKIMDENEHIDEVLAVYMKGPKTYTGEDVVEINCHGSMVALRKTLALVLSKGARMAEPGEFTKRAFLNGRLDLSQAEAVIDVIKAKSDRSFDVAISQLEGSLSKRIEKIRQALLDLLVEVTVNIDYPDEDIEIMTYDKARDCLCNIRNMIGELLATSGSGRMIREGIRIAIVGKPNVGKSSLMNCLLRESRAIVTEIPGTTRDTIEEAVSIRNLPVYLIDTAGIRDTDDTVEKIGIEKTKEAFNNADYIILVVDGSRPLTSEDEEIISYVRGRRALVLLNKRDLGAEVTVDVISEKLPDCDIIETALSKGEGLTEIEDNIESLVYGGQISQGESLMVNNVRHIDLLKHADSAAGDALSLLEIMEPLDIVEIDIRNAYDFLGEIVGDTVSDEIINEVFARFCLGK